MTVPTRLIHRAALATGRFKLKEGKFMEYRDLEYVEVPGDTCYLCGLETGGVGLPRSRVIKATFTDHGLARAGNSDSVCSSCAFCLAYRELRNYSILATGEWIMHPARHDLRAWLLVPPGPPFVFCVAKSGQKWVHIRGEVAYSRELFPVQFEETRVYVEPDKFKAILGPVEELYNGGFSKAEIETGQYSQKRIMDYGIQGWREKEDQVKPHRGGRQFGLAVFAARREEAPWGKATGLAAVNGAAPVKSGKQESKKEEDEGCSTTTSGPKTRVRQLRLF